MITTSQVKVLLQWQDVIRKSGFHWTYTTVSAENNGKETFKPLDKADITDITDRKKCTLFLTAIHPVDHHGRNYDRHVERNDRYLKSSKKGSNGHYLRYPEFSGRWEWYLEYVIQKLNSISEVYYIPDTTCALTTVCQIEKHTLSYWKLLILAIASSAGYS